MEKLAHKILVLRGNKKEVRIMRVENDLRKHNQITIDNIMKFFKTERKCCAIQATGTGKTYLILRLLEIYNDIGKFAIIIAPNREIIKQTKNSMKKFELNNAQFYTYQKLLKMTDEEIMSINCDLIICDELHRVGAKKWGEKVQLLLDTHVESKLFGVTATNIRCIDGRDIAEEYFDGNKVCEISLAEALVKKIIPIMPTYISGLYTFDEECNNLNNRILNGNNTEEEKEELQRELQAAKKQLEKSNGVSEIIKKYITNYDGKYIVFCRDKKHLDMMISVVENWFRKAGFNGNIFSYPFYSTNSVVKNNLKLFESNQQKGLKLLFVIDKLNEGLHLKQIDGCILLRTTVSNIIYYQQIGRVIDAGAMNQRIILDLVSNFNSLKSCNLKKDLQNNIDKRKHGDFIDYGCGSEDFDIDEFSIIDMVQDVIDVFKNIDDKISGLYRDWTDNEIEILKKYYILESVDELLNRLPNRTRFCIRAKANSLNLFKQPIRNKWTKEEDDILRNNYILKTKEEICNMLPNHSIYSIKYRASKLGMNKLKDSIWSKDEIDILTKYYSKESAADISKRIPNRSIAQIRDKAENLGLVSHFRITRSWSEDEENILKKYYPLMGVKCIEFLPNKSKKAIASRAHICNLHVKKRKKYKYIVHCHDKWEVRINVNGKILYFGSYSTKEEAGKVAKEKALEYGNPWDDLL